MMSRVVFVGSLAFAFLVTAGCSSGSGGGGATDAGTSGSGGSITSGGSGGRGAAGGTTTGGTGGTAGGSAGAAAGGASGAAGSATGGAPPMCVTSAECGAADISFPGNTEPPVASTTECAGGRCGLVTSNNGSYQTPKQPTSCAEICAASTYEGQPMVCSARCAKAVINGFGDESLIFGDAIDGSVGAGSLAGLARFQFSPISGAYQFEEMGCSEVPPKKLIKGSNSYTYVGHQCCCVAP